MSRPKAVMAWSSGKDAAWALHEVRRADAVEVVGLLTTLDAARDRVAMHDARGALVRAQADSLDLPLHEVPLPWPCPDAVYEARMAAAVAPLVAAGVSRVVFGDLFLEDIRAYREDRLRGSGLEPLFPLWGRDTAALAAEMIAGGLEAWVVTVDTARLPASFAGRRFDEALLADLPPGVDPCGENGELHTFVSRAPGFERPIPVVVGATSVRDGFAYAEVHAG